MAFFGLAMILLIVYGIEFLDGVMQKKNDKTIEEIHRRAYEWIDENTDDPVLAVKRKAEIDAMVHDTVRSKGREYNPPTLREMSKEDLWHYEEHTEEEKREHMIQCYMKQLGDSREEAETAVAGFYKAVREMNNNG